MWQPCASSVSTCLFCLTVSFYFDYFYLWASYASFSEKKVLTMKFDHGMLFKSNVIIILCSVIPVWYLKMKIYTDILHMRTFSNRLTSCQSDFRFNFESRAWNRLMFQLCVTCWTRGFIVTFSSHILWTDDQWNEWTEKTHRFRTLLF